MGMTDRQRPLADQLELAMPRLAAFSARVMGQLPDLVRRRVLQTAALSAGRVVRQINCLDGFPRATGGELTDQSAA